MTCRVAINGYGRIGQSVLRAVYEQQHLRRNLDNPLKIVAINELSDVDTIAYLTRYDTTHGRFPYDVLVHSPTTLKIQDDLIQVTRCNRVEDLPWESEGVDLVLECTGAFNHRVDADKHLRAGAKRVLLSQPGDDYVDKTIVYGLNHSSLSGDDKVVSNASCTTNAVIPILNILHKAFDIRLGSLTTIHSAMNDQPTIDAYHHHDLRRTRSAMHNIVPVDTQLARGVERILPELTGRLTATAMRVPTINVSAIELNLYVENSTDVEEINALLESAARNDKYGVLAFTKEPLASCDFIHDPHSSIIDGSQTQVSGSHLIKVLTWFDNEWAYANRMLDVSRFWLDKIDLN
jgi:glyceraldehyde 3-phosphate dehydrogenase/D-erythrose 4-phosphate dehydrogenase